MDDLIKECRGCGAETLIKLIDFRDMPIGNNFSPLPNTQRRFPIGLFGCNECDLVQLKHAVFPNLIFGSDVDQAIRAIPEIRMSKRIDPAGKPIILQVGGLSNKEIEGPVNGKNLFVSLEAFLIKRAAENGALIESLEKDFSESAISELLRRYGKVDEVQITNASKGVHPLHLSNISNIPRYLTKLLCLLKENGRVFIRFPNLDQIIKHSQIGYIYHEHQSYFDRDGLIRVMGGFGLDLVFERDSQDNLNVEMTFQRLGGRESKEQLVNDRGRVPGYICNQRLNEFRDIGDRLERVRKRLAESLGQAPPGNYAGYGASVAGVTTMYQTGLDRKLDLLVDDNERKAGLFSPGNNLPVLLTKSLGSMKIECTVILIPRFERGIRRRYSGELGNLQTASLLGILSKEH